MRKQSLHFMMAMAALGMAAMPHASANAQSLWTDRRHDSSITLETLKPVFKSDDAGFRPSARSGWMMLISSRWRLSENLHFISEIPFATGEREYEFAGFDNRKREAGTAFGNPYFGLEKRDQESRGFVEFGIRFPLPAADEGWGENSGRSVGLYANGTHLEAYGPKALSIIAMSNSRFGNASGPFIRLRGGLCFLINTGPGGFIPVFAPEFGLKHGYESSRFSAALGYSARLYAPGIWGVLVHELGFKANVGLGRFWPGVHFRMPLSNPLEEELKYVVGLHLGVQLQ